MNKIKIRIEAKKWALTGPASWEDLRQYRWPDIAPYLERAEINSPEFLAILFVQKRLFKRRRLGLKFWDKIPPAGLLALYNTLDFLEIELATLPPFDYVKIGREKFYLPASKLQNVSLIEFGFLDMAFQLFTLFESQGNKAKAQEWKYKFCAYLCRPKDPKIDINNADTYLGDVREKFNTAIIDRRLGTFSKVSDQDLFGCLFFFASCKRWINQKYKGVLFYDTHDEEGNEIIGVQQSKPRPSRYIDLASNMAGGKFGTLPETRYTNLYDVLEELANQIRTRRANA